MSMCVKLLTLLTQLRVRKQWDVIRTHLPHLLNRIISVLDVCVSGKFSVVFVNAFFLKKKKICFTLPLSQENDIL